MQLIGRHESSAFFNTGKVLLILNHSLSAELAFNIIISVFVDVL